MAEINLNKKDIIWSYLAQFLSMGAGVLTLPFILTKLSTEEIGLNYILITVGSVIALVDLGFAPQFARNFTYVFSGVQELKKVGVGSTSEKVNYELLAYLLTTARYVYAVLAVLALVMLILIGTPYVYKTTGGFTAVPNALWVWIVYSFGVLFQVFYSYYFSMLIGVGKIKEQKYALVGNKLLYIAILLTGLYSGWGLMSVALAQLISPFFGRYLSYRYFYTPQLKKEISAFPNKERKKIIEIFLTLWHNAKRVAVMQIGAYAIVKFNMFIAGLFISLDEFASYGLMVQLVAILATMACTYIQVSQTKFASLRASKNDKRLLGSFSFSLIVFYVLFFVGSAVLVAFGPDVLTFIKANATLPLRLIIGIYCIVIFLESNHSNFAILISTDNRVPFAPASITTGIAVCIGSFIVLKYTDMGILGLVLVQGLCQAAYQNWKWPLVALRDFHISFFGLLKSGWSRTSAH